MATRTAPESTLSLQDGSILPLGGCTCAPARRAHRGPRTTFEDCTCQWGTMIRQMLYLGYGATTAEAVHNLAELGGNFNVLACRRRREILQEQLYGWAGTTAAFCRAHQITRAQFDNFGLRRR